MQFDALAARRVAADLFGDVRVFTFGTPGDRLALALGATSLVEDALDAAESLFAAYAIVAGSTDALDAFAGPMPRGSAIPGDVRGAVDSSTEAARLRHDLRNVLTSLQSTRELLLRFGTELSPSEAHHFEEVVERECDRVGALLGRAARGEGEHPMKRHRSPAAAIVRDVVDAERAESARDAIEIFVQISAAIATEASPIDDADLARILRNLIVNAREALARVGGGSIRVALERTIQPTGDELRLTVEDDGPGISPLALDTIFESGVSTNSAEGRGQGLAIVRSLARRAGGDARAHNRIEGGATFEVDLGSHDDLDPDASLNF
jgi:signal transduction histidine kinase